MKKNIIQILGIMLCISFVACSKQSEESATTAGSEDGYVRLSVSSTARTFQGAPYEEIQPGTTEPLMFGGDEWGGTLHISFGEVTSSANKGANMYVLSSPNDGMPVPSEIKIKGEADVPIYVFIVSTSGDARLSKLTYKKKIEAGTIDAVIKTEGLDFSYE